jgi:hypothetical protein
LTGVPAGEPQTLLDCQTIIVFPSMLDTNEEGLCVSRRTSIWSLRKRIETGRKVRLVTIEVNNVQRTIVQVRRRWNKMPTEHELSLLAQWGDVGGPKLAYWLPR